MKLVRRYQYTPEQLVGVGTFVATPDVVWDGDDVDYAIETSDWQRLDDAASDRVAMARDPSHGEAPRPGTDPAEVKRGLETLH